MTEEVKASAAKKSLALLESVVEGKFLILLLCFAFYLDIWLIQNSIDPTTLTLKGTFSSIQSIPIFIIFLFIASYSLLMTGFFPSLRKIIGLFRLYFQNRVYLSNKDTEHRKLADWSLAFVCLSSCSGVLGYFYVDEGYSGLTAFVFNFLNADGIVESLFRLCIFILWLYCSSLAITVDDSIEN